MATLDGLEQPPRLATHLACLEGGARYMEVDVSTAWLYGGTGHAFVMCLGEDLCPSGPHCWRQGELHRLCRNLPVRIGLAGAGPRATPELLAQAWENVRKSIDKGHPCYGWHWEWILIKGYGENGYLYPDSVPLEGPGDWHDFGAKAIGFLEVYSVEPNQPAPDEKTVREALAFAVEWSQSADKWALDGYDGGVAAYDTWIRGMMSGKASKFGLAYHATIWRECRAFAVEFLKEANARTGGKHAGLFEDAIREYEGVRDSLAEISRLWPLPAKGQEDAAKSRTLDDATRDAIVAQLRKGKQAEAKGIDALRQIVRALSAAGAYRGAPGLRHDLYELMNGLDKTQELGWGRVFRQDAEGQASELAKRCTEFGCTQVVSDGAVLWLNNAGQIEATFCYVPQPGDLGAFRDVYRRIERTDSPLTFVVFPQVGREQTFDAHRLSRRSYLEHSWELGLKSKAEPVPLAEGIRSNLYDMFRTPADAPTSPLSKQERGYWSWRLSHSDERTAAALAREARRYGCTQTVDGDDIIWTGAKGNPDVMFRIVRDPSDPMMFLRIYDRLIDKGIPLAYCFVNQLPDGDGDWDVWSLSRQRAQTHCWRFWAREAQPEPAARD